MKKKIKVLEVSSGISTEGIGQFLLNVYENINKEDIEINFALATKYEQYYEERLVKQGAKIFRTYEIGDGLIGKVKHFTNLIKILNEQGPFDIMHTHMDFFNGVNLLAAFICRVPVRISHAHLAKDESQINNYKKLYIFLMRRLIKIFSTNSLGCSKKANKYINNIDINDNNNNIVINNGIDFKQFNIENKKKSLKDKTVRFVTIGRIEDQKNPIFIIKVIRELCKLRKDIELLWIGVGNLENEVKNKIIEYNLTNNIKMLGRRSDINLILQEVDFMLFPSKYEGLGIVLIESQLAGVPAFISNTIPKEADLGLCTVLNLEDSAEVWAKKIDRYIREKKYNNCLDKNIANKFNIKETSKELERIYFKLTNNKEIR